MTEMGDAEDRAPEGDADSPAARFLPTTASLISATGKAAVVAPAAVIVSYADARLVRASTGETGWLFGTEFLVIVLILAGLYIRGWTGDDDPWVSVFVLGTLVAALAAGPLLLFHGVLPALAAVPGVVVLGTAAAVVVRTCGFDVDGRGSHRS